MDFISTIASQGGSGWLLFSGALVVIWMLFRALITEKDKRAADVLQLTQVYIASAKDQTNAQANLQKSIDSIISILEKVKWKG